MVDAVGTVITILLALGTLATYLDYRGFVGFGDEQFQRLFSLDREYSVPATVSVLGLASCSVVLALITAARHYGGYGYGPRYVGYYGGPAYYGGGWGWGGPRYYYRPRPVYYGYRSYYRPYRAHRYYGAPVIRAGFGPGLHRGMHHRRHWHHHRRW